MYNYSYTYIHRQIYSQVLCINAYMYILLLFSHQVTLLQPHELYSPSDSSVHGTPQAKPLERVAISFSGGCSKHRDLTSVPCLAGGHFTTEPPGKPQQNTEFTILTIFKWVGQWFSEIHMIM